MTQTLLRRHHDADIMTQTLIMTPAFDADIMTLPLWRWYYDADIIIRRRHYDTDIMTQILLYDADIITQTL